jgi:hypothetical protein
MAGSHRVGQNFEVWLIIITCIAPATDWILNGRYSMVSGWHGWPKVIKCDLCLEFMLILSFASFGSRKLRLCSPFHPCTRL